MFYNLLEFPEASPGGRDIILRNILNEYEPDIFMVCELQDQEGSDSILNTSLNDEGNDYKSATFVLNESSSSPLQQMLYFRKNMFTLEMEEVINTNIRDINRYVLKLNTANGQTDPVVLEIYVVHLKSSQGSENQAIRLDMVNEFTSRLGDLDPNAYVIFTGDLNVYTASEDAYQELLDPTNAITMVDPINRSGSWNNNINFQDIHTQSTRINAAPFGAGAGGGLDDRFDFILVSENMMSDPKMKYIPGSYKAFGNNGNCYNNDINSTDCDGEFGLNVRSRLFSMSDHLPVIMELETDEEIVLSNTDFEASSSLMFLEKTLVRNELKLQFGNQINESIEISIYNTLGQKMGVYRIQNSKTFSINTSQWSSGVYILKSNLSLTEPIKFLKVN